MLANSTVDAFILSVVNETLEYSDYHHFEKTIDQGILIVILDRVLDEIHCDQVVVNDTSSKKTL